MDNLILSLETALIDWLTVTSYEPLTHDLQSVLINKTVEQFGKRAKVVDGSRFLQYVGWQVSTNQGTLFCGYGKQAGRDHWIVRVSGELCNDRDILTPLLVGISENWLTCTRIDLQITINEPEGWNQWALFNRRKQMRKSVGWHESKTAKGTPLATVYLGQRTSGKFARVYQKTNDSTIWLRCEYELKSRTAQAYAKMLARNEANVSELLKMLIQQTADDKLSLAFLPHLESYEGKAVKVENLEPRTEKWLRYTVLPSFERYVMSHDANHELVDLFQIAINRANFVDSTFDTV
jgi:hypothetical protein